MATKKNEDVQRNEAYAIRKIGKLLRVLLDELKNRIGPEDVRALERRSGVDLDNDGRVGFMRWGFGVILLVCIMAGIVIAATTIQNMNTADGGTYTLISNDNGTNTLTVDVIVPGAITASGNMTVGGTLGVTGITTLSSNLVVSKSASVGTTLGVTGIATLSSNLVVSKSASVGTTLGVTGIATLSSNLIVSKSATVGTTLGVSGATTLSNTTVNGTLTIANAGAISGPLNAATFSNVTANGTLEVLGNTTLTGDINVNGEDIFSTAALNLTPTDGTVYIESNLTVTADASVGRDLSVVRTTTLSNTTVNGTLTMANAGALSAPLNAATVSNLTVNGTAGIAGAVTLSGDVTGATTALTVSNGTFNGLVTLADSSAGITGTVQTVWVSNLVLVGSISIPSGGIAVNGITAPATNIIFDMVGHTTTLYFAEGGILTNSLDVL